MRKLFLSIAVFVMALCANAQTNQYFWYQGNLMMGNPIAQIDSVTFGDGESVDTLHILLPRTIIKVVHDTTYIIVHDTVCPNDIPQGALAGEFSVSATKKVRFSKGNLQYNAALGTHQCADGTTQQGTWRFSENQYDTIGIIQQNRSASYSGWIDAFAWGTSGWNSGAVLYRPWELSNRYSDFYVGGSPNNNLIGNYKNADWGVYNAISNGGNIPNAWRLLTSEEWNYLLNERPNHSNLCAAAMVNEIPGKIILPDNCILPTGIQFVGFSTNASDNQYSLCEWSILEKCGAIFLPRTAGWSCPTGESVWVDLCGMYWSSTHGSNITALGIVTLTHELYTGRWRCDSGQVRLVQDVE